MSEINNGEWLFRRPAALALFLRIFREAERRFAFEFRGIRLENEWLLFYIKPADGLQLPVIMKWLKQTFAVRFNKLDKRRGHSWGDRYRSRVLEGEPPAEADGGGADSVFGAGEESASGAERETKKVRVRPYPAGKATKARFRRKIPFRPPPPPG
jgi:hypothetical protein